jgi:hypothetical protein
MGNQQLIDYINQSRQQGISDEEIKRALLDAGWQENDIAPYFYSQENMPATPTPTAPFPSFGNLLNQTLKSFGSNLHKFGLILIPPLVVSLVVTLLTLKTKPNILLTAIFFILNGLITYLSYLAILAFISKDNALSVAESYKTGLKMFFPFIWISILGGFASFGAAILLIVPGIILVFRLGLAPFTLFTENKRGLSALIQSWHYVKGKTGKVIGFGFLFILLLAIAISILNILMGVPPGQALKAYPYFPPQTSLIKSLISLIVYYLSYFILLSLFSYKLFLPLKAQKPESLSPEEEQKTKKKILIFTTIGILALIALVVLGGFLLTKFLTGLKPVSSVQPTPALTQSAAIPQNQLSPSEVYIAYRREFDKANSFDELLATASKYVSKGQIEEIKNTPTIQREMAFKLVKSIFADSGTINDIRIVNQEIGVNTATLSLETTKNPNVKGTVSMVLEDGTWKVDLENWKTTYR